MQASESIDFGVIFARFIHNPVKVVVGFSMLAVIFALFYVIVRFSRKPADKVLEEPKAAAKPRAAIETPVVIEAPADPVTPPEVSWIERLRSGLAKTRESLQKNILDIVNSKAIDEATLEKIHEVLYRSDIGVITADKLVEHVRIGIKATGSKSWDEVRDALSLKAREILSFSARPLSLPTAGPFVILVVGVNGVGKTTTIGKLASQYTSEGKKVLMCAADTYRAAAIDQLKVWGERIDVPVIAHQEGADPAAVAYDGVKAAMARGADVLLIDTAGRLQNKENLMKELAKIKKVIGKDLPDAPHEVFLVLDATVGQNAFSQVQAFKEIVDVTGLLLTKLDGTAKGGVVIGIADRFQIPIRYIGVGEKVNDLREFKADEFVQSMLV